jgi:VWFA-related protein
MNVHTAPYYRFLRHCSRVWRASGFAILLAILEFAICGPGMSQAVNDADAQRSQNAGVANPSAVIKTKVSEVLVPVVVRDGQGHAVGGLTRDNFRVFDNGKAQTITGFTKIDRSAEAGVAKSSVAEPKVDDSPTISQLNSAAQRFVVFFFDDYNLTFTDLPHVQLAALRVLDSALAPTDFAAVISTSGTNSGLTRDHAKLKQAILDLKVKPLLRMNERECPNVDYYQGDQIVNRNDEQALQAAVIETMHCIRNIVLDAAESIARTAAERAVMLGEQNYRANLGALQLILEKLLAPLPGQHVIILVSSGFFATGADAARAKSEIVDLAARTATVVNALDARGLYTTNVGAEVTTRVDEASQRLVYQIRAKSMDAAAGTMQELADGTGGTFFHNNNDIEAGLNKLVSGAEHTYLLTFSPSRTKGGVRHKLKIKVNEPGLTVQARREYSIATGKRRE